MGAIGHRFQALESGLMVVPTGESFDVPDFWVKLRFTRRYKKYLARRIREARQKLVRHAGDAALRRNVSAVYVAECARDGVRVPRSLRHLVKGIH